MKMVAFYHRIFHFFKLAVPSTRPAHLRAGFWGQKGHALAGRAQPLRQQTSSLYLAALKQRRVSKGPRSGVPAASTVTFCRSRQHSRPRPGAVPSPKHQSLRRALLPRPRPWWASPVGTCAPSATCLTIIILGDGKTPAAHPPARQVAWK